jgi:RND family efflux transporter MFP subunit
MTRLRWEIALMFALTAVTLWLALGGRLSGWWGSREEITVHVAPVGKSALPETLRLRGTLMAVNEIHAFSQLAGRVAEVRVKSGDAVQAGAVIATIQASGIAERQSDLQSALLVARQDLTAKENRLASAERLTDQRRELFQQDLIARRDVEQAQAALQSARAEAELARALLAQQEAMLAQAQNIQSFGQLRAPKGGVVSRRWVEPGTVIAQWSPVVSIASGDLIKFSGRITGTQSARLREGLDAVILAGESIDGVVSRVISDETKETMSAEIEIQGKAAAAKFRFGTAAEAEITLARAKGMLHVPRSAIFESAGQPFVYKYADGRAVRQAVRLGASDGDQVMVEEGVNSGDLVIVDKLLSITPSSRIRPLLGDH